MEVLDRYTLADMLGKWQPRLTRLMHIPTGAA
jgi:Rrf2 family nitric oxide-sensitive transcriptional repressor